MWAEAISLLLRRLEEQAAEDGQDAARRLGVLELGFELPAQLPTLPPTGARDLRF